MPGDFVFFLTYWDSIIYPLKFLTNHVRWLVSDFVDAERLLLLLKTRPSIVDSPVVYPLAVRDGEVRFEDVSLSTKRDATRSTMFPSPPHPDRPSHSSVRPERASRPS